MSAHFGGETSLRSLALLVPAWQPTSVLLVLLAALDTRAFGAVVVVDDGSAAVHGAIFAQVAGLPRVRVLRHAQNRGKGYALKTGFRHILVAYPEITGVVTADADGQHTAEDILRVARALLASGRQPVLGCRHFEQHVPWRSRVGNTLIRRIFAWRTGVALTDTQTGLRGLPRAALVDLLELPGERYEYETAMLCSLCRSGPRPLEVPIATVYLEGNRGSHFHPLWDSLRVCLVLLRFR